MLNHRSSIYVNNIFNHSQLLPDRRGGRPESSLSPSTWGGGTPSPLLAPGRVTSSRQLFGVCPVLLWRRCYVERVVLTIWEWEPQPLHSHWSSSSRALFPPQPPVASMAWILERGDDVVRVRLRLWIRHSAATPTLRETSATPCGPGYGDTSSSGFLSLELAPTAGVAWPWFLTSPLLHQPCAYPVYVHHSLTLYVSFCPGRLQRLGTTPTTAGPGRQAWRLRGARRHLTSDVKCACLSSCWLRLGDTRPGPCQNFSFPPESPTDALLTSRQLTSSTAQLTWFIYSILIAIVIVIIAIIIIVIFIIVTVCPLFKRNIYLSLLCDWIIFFLKIIFFSFFQVCSWSMWSQN